MENWATKTDDQVFSGAHEQPGSQASYYRDIEIKRRLYALQRRAIEEQREATRAQREAIAEMRSQSSIMFWSVIGIFATAVVTLLAAFI